MGLEGFVFLSGCHYSQFSYPINPPNPPKSQFRQSQFNHHRITTTVPLLDISACGRNSIEPSVPPLAGDAGFKNFFSPPVIDGKSETRDIPEKHRPEYII